MNLIKRIRLFIKREKEKSPRTNMIVLLLKRIFEKIINFLSYQKMILLKDSTFNTKDSMWMCSLFPQKILDILVSDIRFKSVIDVGCGTGTTLKYFLDNGIEALGVENSALAISKSPVKNFIIQHNLNRPINLNRKFDMVWCFEVIEHIHPKYESIFLNNLIIHSDLVVLSAARPGQGGHGHFNEQEPSYWINRFENLGFLFDEILTKKLKFSSEIHADNMLCFRKR